MRGSRRPKGFGLFNTEAATAGGDGGEGVNMMKVMEPDSIRRDWMASPEVDKAMKERDMEFVKKNGSRVEIGRGAFAKAYLAKKSTGKEYVVKEVDLTKLGEDQKKKAGLEVTFLKSLNHIHVIGCTDAFNTAGILNIVLEYASGGTLASVIDDKKKACEKFSPEEVLRWAAQLAAALQHLHGQKVLHRDLKTANVFLDSELRVKLGDFGLSRKLEDADNFSGQQVGTPYYFAPEVVQSKPFSNKTDIWSAGVIIYELAFLQKPFQAKSIRGLYRKIESMSYETMPTDSHPDIRRILQSILVEQTARPSASKLCRDEALSGFITSVVVATPPRASLTPDASPQADPLNSASKKSKDDPAPKERKESKTTTTSKEPRKKSRAVAKMLQSVVGSVRGAGAGLEPLPQMSPSGGRCSVVSSPPKVKAKATTVRYHPPPPPPKKPPSKSPDPEDDSTDYEDDFEDAPNNSDSGDYFDDEDDYDDDFESFDDTDLLQMKELVGLAS